MRFRAIALSISYAFSKQCHRLQLEGLRTKVRSPLRLEIKGSFMNLSFEKVEMTQAEDLADWLSSESWPFFIGHQLEKSEVLKRIKDGAFFGKGEENFWVKDQSGEAVGFIELYQLDDLAPMFSMRLKSAFRGRGYGKICLNWLTKYIFENFSGKRRIEGQTREDNVAMRKVFNKCGYVKEAYFRMANPTEDGGRLACVGYGILREDWESGRITPVAWNSDAFFSDDIF